LALRGLFEGKLAACELPGPRSKLKNRINTFLTNPLCRDVDALCTKQAEDIVRPVEDARYGICEAGKTMSSAENVNKECMRPGKWCRKLLVENERLEDLVELAMDANDRNNGVVRQYQSALMH
jgi:hypothetical protein